jgi:hypothetical protein
LSNDENIFSMEFRSKNPDEADKDADNAIQAVREIATR